MKSKSIKGKSTEDIKLAIENSMSDGFLPTVAVLFISIKQDRKAISELLDSKNIDVFGATSCGEFTNTGQTEGEIAMLLLDLSKAYYHIHLKKTKQNLLIYTQRCSQQLTLLLLLANQMDVDLFQLKLK